MKKYITVILLILWSVTSLYAQATLLLKKQASKLEYQFIEGERLKIKLKTSREVLKGSWHYETENTIIIAGQSIVLDSISWIDVSSKEKGIWLLRKGQDALILAGVGYLAVSQVNSLIEREQFETDNQVYLSSAHLVAAGLLCRGLDRVLRRRKVHININKSRYRIYLL